MPVEDRGGQSQPGTAGAGPRVAMSLSAVTRRGLGEHSAVSGAPVSVVARALVEHGLDLIAAGDAGAVEKVQRAAQQERERRSLAGAVGGARGAAAKEQRRRELASALEGGQAL